MRLTFEMKRSYEIWNISPNGKSCRVMQNVLTTFGPIINHLWYFVQFGTICTNDFRANRSQLIRLNSFNIRHGIWQRFLIPVLDPRFKDLEKQLLWFY